MQADTLLPNRTSRHEWPAPQGEKLERALVAGLLLEIMLETSPLPASPEIRRLHIKSRLTHSLVMQLAGHITLDRFRLLMRRLDQWFPLYYPLVSPLPQAEDRQNCLIKNAAHPDVGQPLALVRRHLLKEWLEQAGGEILPRRPQSKIQPARLEEFFQRLQIRWFRVKDLARDFDIDRKTAWEYLQKLRDAGLLIHNGGRSAAVRYRLADRFLKIRLTTLERQMAKAMVRLPQSQVEQITEWLAATSGEPFWEEQWPGRLAATRRPEIIASLESAGLLEVMGQSGCQRLLRLQRQWLRE